jgi:hypothetical protein
LFKLNGTGVAERDTALLAADFVLEDEGTAPSHAQSQSEPRQSVVEYDDLRATDWQGQGLNDPLCESHLPIAPILGRLWEDCSRIFPPSLAIYGEMI